MKLNSVSALKLASVAAAAAGVSLLTGCVTSQPVAQQQGVYKFTVFHYKQPVPVAAWTFNSAKADCPEGAALNVATCMEQGNVDKWIASWSESERPKLTTAERAALAQKWQSLKDGHIAVLNRIVVDADIVIELSVTTPDQKVSKLQIPLNHSNNQWSLTSLDASSDCLHWETSNNKIVANCESKPLEHYLSFLSFAKAN